MTFKPTTPENQKVLDAAKEWFRNTMVNNHIANTEKLVNPNEFNINMFLTPYLSYYLTGKISAEGIAKSLVLARVLSTSITTSFGTNLQNFISTVLVNAYGSIVHGVDISYVDKIDGRTKYAQLKLGPNTINSPDVKTIHDHFKDIKNLARTNHLQILNDDLVVGVLYGKDEFLSAHYLKLREEHHYSVLAGNDFWLRLTGDDQFMDKLAQVIRESFEDVNTTSILDNVIKQLSETDQINNIAKLGSTDT